MSVKDKIEQRLEAEAKELRTLRDELRVQVHLGQRDAQDLWSHLEDRWQHAEAKLRQVGGASREAAEDVGEAARLVLDELRAGYQKIRELL